MDAAIIELDALADAVGAAAEDHHLAPVAGPGLVFFLVGRIIIRGMGLELGCAGVHQLVDRLDLFFFPQVADIVFRGAGEKGQLPVREAVALGPAQKAGVKAGEAGGPDRLFQFHDLPEIVKIPGVDGGQAKEILVCHAPAQGLVEVEDALGIGDVEQAFEILIVEMAVVEFRIGAKAVAADLKRAHALLEGLAESTADGHGLAHRFHGRGQDILGFREFLKGPARDLDHAVVDAGLKGGHGLPGDVVGDFVQGVAHRQLGRDLGDGKAGGLGGQGRAPRDPGVHLDDHDLAVGRIDRELDIGAAGLHPDFPHDGQGGVAQGLVFAVGQGLGRGHGDGIAGVDPHGVEVLDGTDDDHVVLFVAHDLELVLLPAQEAALEHDLGIEAQVEAADAEFGELLLVVGHAAAGAAEGEARAHDDGKTDAFGRGVDLVGAVDDGALRD